MRNPITDLRIVGACEGLSFLLLLVVAMPLKYVAGIPFAVRIAGMLHGVLFVFYLVAVVRAARAFRWPIERVFEAIVASLYPLGTFLLDRRLREEATNSPNHGLASQSDPTPKAGNQEGAR